MFHAAQSNKTGSNSQSQLSTQLRLARAQPTHSQPQPQAAHAFTHTQAQPLVIPQFLLFGCWNSISAQLRTHSHTASTDSVAHAATAPSSSNYPYSQLKFSTSAQLGQLHTRQARAQSPSHTATTTHMTLLWHSCCKLRLGFLRFGSFICAPHWSSRNSCCLARLCQSQLTSSSARVHASTDSIVRVRACCFVRLRCCHCQSVQLRKAVTCTQHRAQPRATVMEVIVTERARERERDLRGIRAAGRTLVSLFFHVHFTGDSHL